MTTSDQHPAKESSISVRELEDEKDALEMKHMNEWMEQAPKFFPKDGKDEVSEVDEETSYREWYQCMSQGMKNDRPYTDLESIFVRKVFGKAQSWVDVWATSRADANPCHPNHLHVTSMSTCWVHKIRLIHPTDKRKSLVKDAFWDCEYNPANNEIVENCFFDKVPEDMFYGKHNSIVAQLILNN
eukprot:TCONS_00064369-protein